MSRRSHERATCAHGRPQGGARVSSQPLCARGDQGTLEPVLTAPVRAAELLLGKAVAAFIPSVGLADGIYLIVLLSVRFGAAHVVSSVVWNPPQLLAQLLFTPLLALWAIWVGIGISTRASDVRSLKRGTALARPGELCNQGSRPDGYLRAGAAADNVGEFGKRANCCFAAGAFDEPAPSLDLRPHRPGRERQLPQGAGCGLPDRLGCHRAPVALDVRDVREHHQSFR